ncbi:MAG: OmpA family protein [Bacteroidales bacterium]|jgi:outer membrane protein OmpA-like peptidoglycan-associated protein|nr:OmpA family protein [Bacteroidales bacterium]
MKRKLLTLTLLLITAVSFSQNQPEGSKYGPFLTNKFFDNWFISAGGGIQWMYGEHDTKASFKNRISPAIDISLGKWITPSIGIRGQFGGFTMKGLSTDPTAKFIEGPSADCAGCFEEKFNFFNLHGDLMWNLSNTIGGYRQDRILEFIPFLGVGYARSYKENVNPVYKEASATVGLLNKIRLSQAVDFNVELKALLVNDRFDGYEVGQGIEELVSATIGFTYNFKKRGFDKYVEPIPCDYSPYTSKISALEQKIADADAKASKLASDLANEKNKKPEVIKSVEYIASPIAIFFPINQSKLTDMDLINLGTFAEAVKKTGKTYKIMGSADKATGSKKINLKLSQDRANSVYNALVNKFGVNASQLQVIAKGDENEPFDKPVLNRVVILE